MSFFLSNPIIYGRILSDEEQGHINTMLIYEELVLLGTGGS